MKSPEDLERERKRGKYWKGKVVKKQKEKRRPDGMTKAEWEKEKSQKRTTKVRNRKECLKKARF